MLLTRSASRLSITEVNIFHNALRVYHTNDKVIRYNATAIVRLNSSVIRITLINTPVSTKITENDVTDNLAHILSLCVEYRVMLLQNL